ncbi:MAG: hypothetical protein CVU63_24080, partial [Deltaproteobacteria bacterium HGW-Deltaproteobacteria-20]
MSDPSPLTPTERDAPPERAATREPAREDVAASALLMVLGAGFFVALAVMVKAASDEATPMQAVLYRSVFSALPLLVIMRVQG